MAWLDCRGLRLPGLSPLDFFLDRAKVAFNGGRDFGSSGEGFVRLNFATSPALLEAIEGRMFDAVSRSAE